MKKVILLRHGQTDGPSGMKGRIDVPISVEGLKTMKMAGYILNRQDDPVQLIVSGPLKRAIQSAQAINENDTRQVIMHEFDEVDIGKLEGKSGGIDLEDYDRNAQANQAENTTQALKRALLGIETLKAMDGQTIVVVTHSFLLVLIYLNLPKVQGLPAMIPMLNGCGFEIDLENEPVITKLFPDGLLEDLQKNNMAWS